MRAKVVQVYTYKAVFGLEGSNDFEASAAARVRVYERPINSRPITGQMCR